MSHRIIEHGPEFSRQNGKPVTVKGIYVAIPSPQKGVSETEGPKNHAIVKLKDGTKVFVEAFGTKEAVRPPGEIRRFDAHTVRMRGTAWRVMPSPGAAPLAPCLTDVSDIVEG